MPRNLWSGTSSIGANGAGWAEGTTKTNRPSIRLVRLWRDGATGRDARYPTAELSPNASLCIAAPRCRRRRLLDQPAHPPLDLWTALPRLAGLRPVEPAAAPPARVWVSPRQALDGRCPRGAYLPPCAHGPTRPGRDDPPAVPEGGGRAARRSSRTRLLRLRLALGGQIGDGSIGPPLCVVFEGWDASGQGRGDQAAGRPARPAPRAGRTVRRADLRREAAPLPVAVLAGAARLGRDGGASTGPGTAGSWSSGSRGSPPTSSGSGPTTRSSTSSAPWPPRA